MNIFLKICGNCSSMSFTFQNLVYYILYVLLKTSLRLGVCRLDQTSKKSMAHTQKKRAALGRAKLSSSPALVALPGFPRAVILRFVCFLRKLVREETGASDKSSWHDVLCSPWVMADSVTAFVTCEGSSQWKMTGSPSLVSLNNN